MMNRRLRERLTEGEILQIFVDVCEGVAAMHNLRPTLLHRDLKVSIRYYPHTLQHTSDTPLTKVENILQANENSYKLCDFGSSTTVTKAPTTTAEMRALESDLNKHTTLQYRAPEMVDPHLRRPIDEKSG
jgi:AP2-associated kinase